MGAETVVHRWHGYLLSFSIFWVLESRFDDVSGSGNGGALMAWISTVVEQIRGVGKSI